jgi:hypothetical protein
MAKRGIKEPEGSENWPVLDRSMGAKRPEKGEKGHVPCWHEKYGHTELATRAVGGVNQKYREGYDRIKWEG